MFHAPHAVVAQPSRHKRLFELLRQQNMASQCEDIKPKRQEGDFLAERLLRSATSSLRRSA
ncbi:hypothetical protein NBRC116594_01970 [Shimia sp. NS0008-38b]|uniref:hypothetical protein n=1 Tax=Shimia sp. NS0008-38b TaxID=3127653 RepID=UPI003103AD57